jgi:hypothetical protein
MSRYRPIDWVTCHPDLSEELYSLAVVLATANVEWDDLTERAQAKYELAAQVAIEKRHREQFEDSTEDAFA